MKIKQQEIQSWAAVIITCFSLSLGNAKADEVQINITGEIYNAPCKINNDVDFDIDFGKVSIQEI
ncbi:fimbrial protein, partial [Yersinia enterocolitica]